MTITEDEPEDREVRYPTFCPYCGRVMSWREATEQGACNDCHGGSPDPWADADQQQ